MPAEAWVALVLGVLGIIGTMLTCAWYLSAKLSKQDVEMVTVRAAQLRMIAAIEKLESVVASIAVDRERMATFDRRLTKLEQWYDELRRGVGKIS
jgi:predicted metal-dependent hydrolase